MFIFRPPRRALSGFSLIELILVLSILAVMATVATPRYASSLSNYRADAAARRVVADLQLARASAQRSSRSVTIVFNAATERYTVSGVADPLTGASTYTVDLTADPYAAVIHSLQLPNGATSITFDGFGGANVDGSITLASGNFTRTIEVTAGRGRVLQP